MTYTILLFVTRKPEITPQAFRDHWENKHIPLLQSLTGPLFPVHTRQYFSRIERKGFGGPANRDHPPLVLRGSPEDVDYDGIAELVFKSEAAFQEFHKVIYATDAAAKLAEDEKNFLDIPKMKAIVIGDTIVSRPIHKT